MYDLIDVSAFKKLLLDCATALQDGNLKLADVHLGMISNLLAKKTDIARSRLVKYYAEGIVRRAYGLHPSLPFFTSRLPYFDKIEPNVLEGKKQLHLIDFYLPHLYSHHFYGPYLFDTLRKVCGDSISVRVSVVLPPFMEKTVDFRREEQFLAREAEKESIKLKDFKMVYANGLGEVDDAFMWDLMMKRRADDDEALVIFYSNKLHRLVAEEGALETELLTLAQINPDVVFISEDNANHNYSNFIQRLDHSFPYYFSTNPVIGIEAQNMKRREIGNIVGCEGKDLVERHLTFDQWRSLFLSTGFMIPIPLYVKGYNGKENGCLVYRDEFHSAWKFCSGVHLDSTSFNSLLRGWT
ncbi:Transcription factor GRAS [Corchorus capsularis]|uniref:Transcription factor GRAS n=1 Tax=Corchorus capsularis TaxID=210143 RepID=A0A1R3IVX2_COCAP|nr:Transcription factor GRAS [Corchorus capsularis]